MTTHENLNVVGQISRAASPPEMKNGKGQSILGVLPMFRKSSREPASCFRGIDPRLLPDIYGMVK